MNKVALCPNPARDIGFLETIKAINILESHCVPYCVAPLYKEEVDIATDLPFETVTFEQALEQSSIIVCFGGDGTILRVARAAAEREQPVLSVNMGRRGFIAELERVTEEHLLKLVHGDYRRDRRIMFEVNLIRKGESIYSDFALNDIVISKGGAAKMIDVSVYSDDKKMSEFFGDGIIVSTPTGSTGYSMSAGGPLVEPTADSAVVTPICAHSMTARAYVLSGERKISVKVGSLYERTAHLSVDGGEAIELQSGDIVCAKRAKRKTTFVRMLDVDFYEAVNMKLKYDVKG